MTAQKLSLRIRINWRTFFLLHRQDCNLWMYCECGSRKRHETRQVLNNFIPGATSDCVCTHSQLQSLSLTAGQHLSFKINLPFLIAPYHVAAISSCFSIRIHCFKICLFMSSQPFLLLHVPFWSPNSCCNFRCQVCSHLDFCRYESSWILPAPLEPATDSRGFCYWVF